MAGAERLFNLLDSPPEWADRPEAVDLPRMRGRVEFQNVRFAYIPERPVLRDIDFAAEPGRTIALVGHTGSGKTTIINLIAKFYLPSAGRLLIDEYEIRDVTGDSLHRQLGIVVQQNFLFTGTVGENIRVGPTNATDAEILEVLRRLDCDDLLQNLPNGLDSEIGERGVGISSGQKQLVSSRGPCLADPRILILDEATSSVDSMTEAHIQRALEVLLAGRTRSSWPTASARSATRTRSWSSIMAGSSSGAPTTRFSPLTASMPGSIGGLPSRPRPDQVQERDSASFRPAVSARHCRSRR